MYRQAYKQSYMHTIVMAFFNTYQGNKTPYADSISTDMDAAFMHTRFYGSETLQAYFSKGVF